MTSTAIQPLAPRRPAQRILEERARGVLMPDESVLAIAGCTDLHRWWFLPPSGVVVTDHRVLLIKLGLFGGLQFSDFHWEHVQDVHLAVGMFSAKVRVTATVSKSGMQSHAVSTGTQAIVMEALAKDEAQAVYRLGQQLEQMWRERQRARYMEEQRLGYAPAAYVQGHAQAKAVEQAQVPTPDVAGRMQQLKSLLDQGLITQAEFDERRAEILRSI